MANKDKITLVFQKLFSAFGPQKWWPTSWQNKKDEIIIGAVLTQNTSWQNVEKSLKNLYRASVNSLSKIRSTPKPKLARLIKTSGYYNQKAKKLKIVADFFYKTKSFSKWPLLKQRSALLSLWGVGEETADSILLYAFEKPLFVVDAYTKRVFYRLGITNSEKAAPRDIQQLILCSGFFKNVKTKREKLLQEFHALLVKLAKTYCFKNNPLCQKCPLKTICQNPKS